MFPLQNKNKGFSLFEILIALSVIVIMTSVAVPFAITYFDKARISRTHQEVKSLYDVVIRFREDTGGFPINGPIDDVKLKYLYSDGDMPDDSWEASGGESDNLSNHFIQNNRGYSPWSNTQLIGWRSAYLINNPIDPWGNCYFIGVQGFQSDDNPQVWVISAGSDSILQTAINATEIAGDDIGKRIR